MNEKFTVAELIEHFERTEAMYELKCKCGRLLREHVRPSPYRGGRDCESFRPALSTGDGG